MSASRPRVLFFGMRGRFSGPPLAALLGDRIPIVGVVLPPDSLRRDPAAPPIRRLAPESAPHLLPMLSGGPTVLDMAREHRIPLFELAQPGDAVALATLAALRPELIAVACFPRILPPALLALPRWGALNLHPSLLPRHRGPAPLFWTFYHGDAGAGVTVHIMDDRVDTGDLLMQADVPIPGGATGPDLERACAATGASLLVASVRGRADGSLTPRPQHEADATYAPWPTPRDLEVPTTWTAERAYRFIRGVSTWYSLSLPLPAPHASAPLRLREAIGVEDNDVLPLDTLYRQVGGEAWVRFGGGVLRVKVLTNSSTAAKL